MSANEITAKVRELRRPADSGGQIAEGAPGRQGSVIEGLLLCSIYRKKRRRANLIDGSDSEIHKIYYAECTYSNIDNTLRTCYTQANGRKGPPAEGGQAS